MLAPTHMIAGQAAFIAVSLGVGHAPTLPEAWLAAAAGLLPDLDKRHGIVGRLFPWLSEPLEYRFGHRTLTHSLLASVVLALMLWPLLPRGVWLAVVAGYASHPVADMLTPAGVEWFWPARWRCVLPGNERYRMRAMGWGELACAVLLAVVTIPLLNMAKAKPGTGSVIAAAIGDIAAARERYDAEKGANRWTLRLEGRDNLTHADVSGDYPIIGSWQGAGFLIRTPEGPQSVCRTGDCGWYVDSAVAVKGEAQVTTTRQIAAEHTSPAALGAALEPLEAVGEVYLIGSLTARGIEPKAPTVAVTGDSVNLIFAAPAVLEEWGARPLRDLLLTVQVRHVPSVTTPEVTLDDVTAGVIPAELRPWLLKRDRISRDR
ncbi:metal-dependent hydrolase [Halomonas sp. G15]|uniref:metal-dependent hydrolase n=1 Tax=Halomonas sp. G15 TaxID=2903521 RepID=UPI001E4B55AA|nr:metal-dependent hydrolase [Halomonas sp. G15]MCE0732463.1 metal-dependent hydrolase [Halomonas sp. G15]